MSKLPVAAFAVLAVATIAAFFFTQHLKVTTPLLAGHPAPVPSAIDPRDGGVCDISTAKGVLTPTDFRSMHVSFYLLNRADDVDVSIVDSTGTVIATLADSRHMAVGRRVRFYWNGRRSDGQYAPDGRYYIQVSLIHQGRTVRISNQNSGAAEPVQVRNGPAPIRVTSVRVDGIEPAVFPQPGPGHPVSVHFTRSTGRTLPTIRVYRTDLPGRPQLVDSYASKSHVHALWNGTLSSGAPAPQGTYLIGLSSVDHTCTRTVFPASLPPAPGSTPHAGVTVRYLAAQPPMTPVAPGSDATVDIDARRHRYEWALRRAGAKRVLSFGSSTAIGLAVRLPGGSDGLYDLAVRWGSHRTVVPLVAGGSGTRDSDAAPSGHVLVVLPSLTWQGLNPVDDDGDGMPNMLALGQPIRLLRPLVNGLPAGFADEAGLLSFLRASGLRYSLTTDLSLLVGGAAALHGWSGVVFAGSEHWLPASFGSALSTYVQQGGHVLSLGLDALRRSVTVSGDQALDPSGPQPVDDLLARPGPVRSTGRSLILVDEDKLHIFSGTAQAFTGFARYQQYGPVSPPAAIASSAGVSTASSAIIGYRLGRGDVVDIGLPDFGSKLAHNVNAGELVTRVWKLLER